MKTRFTMEAIEWMWYQKKFYHKGRAVWTGSFAAYHPTIPPPISLYRPNPLSCNKVAAMVAM
jgi:hypothetical protein